MFNEKNYRQANIEVYREYKRQWQRWKRHPDKYNKPKHYKGLKPVKKVIEPPKVFSEIDPRAKSICVRSKCGNELDKSLYPINGNFCGKCVRKI